MMYFSVFGLWARARFELGISCFSVDAPAFRFRVLRSGLNQMICSGWQDGLFVQGPWV